MYEVVSQQRPGRPAWATATGLLLLLATLLLAQALIHVKATGQMVAMGPAADLAGNFRGRLPSGWEPIPTDELPQGILVGLAERAGDESGLRRRLFLFRAIPSALSLASDDGVEAAKSASRRLAGSARQESEVSSASHIGPYPAFDLRTWGVGRGADSIFVHCTRTAVTPANRIFGIVLEFKGITSQAQLRSLPRQADLRLINALSEDLSLRDEALSGDLQTAMTAAGLSFSPPSGVTAVIQPADSVGELQLTGGRELSCWFLDVYRLPMTDPRRPAELMANLAATVLRRIDAGDTVQAETLATRKCWSVGLMNSDESTPARFAWALQTDEHTGLLIIGRSETEGVEALNRLARMIAADAVVTPWASQTELTAAEQRGRRLLDELRGGALAAYWTRFRGDGLSYRLKAVGWEFGNEKMVFKRDVRRAAWNISSVLKRTGHDISYESSEQWTVADAELAHQRTYRVVVPQLMSEQGALTDYRETWAGGVAQVERQLKTYNVRQKETRTSVDSIAVSGGYACEPVLLAAAARMAVHPTDGPAMFFMTDAYAPHLIRWVMSPLGKAPLPGDNPGREAFKVRLQIDHDPVPIYLFFDEEGTLDAVDSDRGIWRERITDVSAAPADRGGRSILRRGI